MENWFFDMASSATDFTGARMLTTSTLGAHPDDCQWLVVLATLAMFYMAWGIGANDCANNFATSFGSGALTLRACLMIAAVMEFCGAIFLGSDVAKTFRKGIADVNQYDGVDGRILVLCGMTSVLIAAATWLLVSSRFGLPVSTTHSAVGGVIAFAVVSKGYDCVKWDKVGMIVLSWVTSPLLSLIISFVVYSLIKKNILSSDRSFELTYRVVPFITGFTAFVIALFVFYKGAKGIDLDDTPLGTAVGIAAAISVFMGACSIPIAAHVKNKLDVKEQIESEKPAVDLELADVTDVNVKTALPPTPADAPEGSPSSSDDADSETSRKPLKYDALDRTEKLWVGFCWITASFEALAHGGNDVANSVGPYAAVLAAKEGDLSKKAGVPTWVFVVAAVGICVGLATYGHNVMRTIGTNITKMRPSKAFAVELSATFVILLATKLGIPISTTHASVGAVMGAGIADEGMKALDWKLLGKIFLSWVFTLPVVAIAAAGLYSFILPTVVDVPIV